MHRTTEQFWERYHDRPSDVRKRADKSFAAVEVQSPTPITTIQEARGLLVRQG